jgi:hypothetical protein
MPRFSGRGKHEVAATFVRRPDALCSGRPIRFVLELPLAASLSGQLLVLLLASFKLQRERDIPTEAYRGDVLCLRIQLKPPQTAARSDDPGSVIARA